MKVDIQIEDRQLREALQRLIDGGQSLRPPLAAIGEALSESTKQRFQTSTGPDGSAWTPNAESTYLGFLSKYSSAGKGGRARIATRAAGKKPLIGESRSLSTTINYQVTDDEVTVGSPMEYAAVQQLGAKRGEFGSTKRGTPIPWGDIPARPFLGVSDEDKATIRQTFNEYLADLAGI